MEETSVKSGRKGGNKLVVVVDNGEIDVKRWKEGGKINKVPPPSAVGEAPQIFEKPPPRLACELPGTVSFENHLGRTAKRFK